MSETKKEEKGDVATTTESKSTNQGSNPVENKEKESKPVTLDERLAEMESRSIEFPNDGTSSAPVESSDTSPASDQKSAIVKKEDKTPMKVEKVESKPVAVKTPVDTGETVMIVEEGSRKVFVALIMGIVIGALLTSFIL